eukprot:1955873-Rhodomonas_salina.1
MIVARVVNVPMLAEEAEEAKEEEEGAEGSEGIRRYLRMSSDSIAYSCGGKEVAEVCLLSAETCVTSMQKKNKYTVEQTIARCYALTILSVLSAGELTSWLECWGTHWLAGVMHT